MLKPVVFFVRNQAILLSVPAGTCLIGEMCLMTKQVYRYRRKKKDMIDEWPKELLPASTLTSRVRYVGSAEHKDYPSFAGDPGLRSDASRCSPDITREQAEEVLKKAIKRHCISPQVEGQFPRYAWGRLGGRLYQARLINREQGWYKAWPIEEIEAPEDEHGRLRSEEWND